MSDKSLNEHKSKREREVKSGLYGGIAGALLSNAAYTSGQLALGKSHSNAEKRSQSFGSDYNKVVGSMNHVKDIAGGASAGGHSIYRTPTGKSIIITRAHEHDATFPSFSSRTAVNDSLRGAQVKTLRGFPIDKGGDKVPGLAELEDYIKSNKRDQINVLATKGNHSILLHELGHSAGTRHGTASGALVRLGNINPPSMATKGVAATGAMLTHRRAGESKEDYEKRSKKNAIKSGLLGSAMYIPTLAEEARATLNANRLGKKLGVKVDNRKLLLPAYGTYVAGALAPTAVALGAHYGKRFVEREMEKKSSMISSKGDIHMGAVGTRAKLLKVHEGLKRLMGASVGGAVGLAATDNPIGVLGGMVVGGVLQHYASTKGNITKATKEIEEEERALLKQMIMRKKKNK